MKTYDPANERIKHTYLAYLENSQGYSPATLDAVVKAIQRYEEYTRYRGFEKFHIEQAMGFKRHLLVTLSKTTGALLSKSTICSTLNHLMKFFHWLADQPGYRFRFLHSHVDYFSPSKKDARIASTRRDPRVPTLAQIEKTVTMMPHETDIERRNRGLVAFSAATGARVNALISAKLKDLNIEEGQFDQDARHVKTKFSKTQMTTLFPVGNLILGMVRDYANWLREQGFNDEDPLFPAPLRDEGKGRFAVTGLSREHWTSSSPVRAIFRKAFGDAALPYFNPHSFRHMLARRAEELKLSLRDYKAWSQNLGHSKMATTFLDYGPIDGREQAQIIRGICEHPTTALSLEMKELARALLEEMRTKDKRSGTI